MFVVSHVLMGMIIGKVTGNYEAAIATSLLIDSDHIVPYIKSWLFLKPKKMLRTFMWKEWVSYEKNYLHNILIPPVIAIFGFAFHSSVLYVIALAYFVHLMADLIDDSEYFPFYPYTKIKTKWPFKHFSVRELILDIVLLVVRLVI